MGEGLETAVGERVPADNVRVDNPLANAPIALPENPYVTSLKTFGLDELLAGIVDAGATTAASFLVPERYKMMVLPFVGPVLEKIGFFPQHVWKARGVYKSTPPSKRMPLSHYVKDALRNGGSNLAKDILVHDPIYVGLMVGGLHALPNVPPGFLSASSYILGVLAVAAIDVTKDELLYRRATKKLKAVGFGSERYYESRFWLNAAASKDPDAALAGLVKEFGLTDRRSVAYEDRYFANTFTPYSNRTVKVRLRHRQATEEEQKELSLPHPWMNSLQIVYTRAREHAGGLDQCRYFPMLKEKYWLMMRNVEAPSSIADIGDKDAAARNLVLASTGSETKDVRFTRTMYAGKELAACFDDITKNGTPDGPVNGTQGMRVLELKVWKDKQLMRQAMRYLMLSCPVVQTTHGKSDFST